MDTIQNSAASRLYTKLSALRKTLPTDERDVFDQIIPAENEVTAHRFAKKRAIKGRAKQAPEATAHRLAKKKSIKGSASKKAPEVTAHRFTKGKAKQTSTRKAKMGAVK